MLRWNCINSANVLIFSHFLTEIPSPNSYKASQKTHWWEAITMWSVWQKFSENSTLIKHQQLDTGEKPFLCDQCNMIFSERSNLTKHPEVHTCKKPFLCDQCDNNFLERYTLIKHHCIRECTLGRSHFHVISETKVFIKNQLL